MVEKDEKFKVPIPQEYRAPVGDHGSQFVSKIVVEDQFEMQDESTDVNKAVATKCGRSLSTHTYRLRKKYLSLKSAKGEEYARSHPPPRCDLEKWKNLIDRKLNDSNWLVNFS
ncbi:hypothetical protein ACSBR1_033697 [Camellia fascicularis]